MKNTGGIDFCSFTSGSLYCDVPYSCTEYSGLKPMSTVGSSNTYFCQSKRDKAGPICMYEGYKTACSLPKDSLICTKVTTNVGNQWDCDLRTLPSYCKAVNYLCAVKTQCNLLLGSSTSYCQNQTGLDGFFCTKFSGSYCEAAPESCSSISGNSSTFNNVYINKYGDYCLWKSGTTLSDPVAFKTYASQFDCDKVAAGKLLYSSSCIMKQSNCTSYTFTTSINTNDLKFKYCNSIVTSSGEQCTFTNASSNCVAVAACSTYTKLGTTFSDNLTYCKKIATTDNYKCVYSSGSNCQETVDLCTLYTGMTTATILEDCALLFDTLGRFCSGVTGATACSYPLCDSITSPTSQSDCDLKSPGCIYSFNKCITLGLCSSYSTGGSNAIAFCNGLKDSNGIQCYANIDTSQNCTVSAKACNDSTTLQFTTNKECQDYSPQCKFAGLGCVDITAPCNTLFGDLTSCPQFLDETGLSNCEASPALTDTAACTAITCEMNVTALSQSDCDGFIVNGGCRWRNPGCYSKSVSCDQYRGTSAECQLFIGNKIKCYGDSVTRGACRNKLCGDKVTAVDDAECAAFMQDCIFNGVGCIHRSSTCSQFQGTTETCKKFKANNGNTLCWSTSSTQAACIDRQCSHLNAFTDAECKAHFNSNCITDGTTCVLGPKQCSDFNGNNETCSKLTATDGPCKSSSISTSAFACTPRVCSDAPNTYTTDSQCQNYYPNCKTNGQGCQSSITCIDYSNESQCSTNPTCLWINSCKKLTQNFSSPIEKSVTQNQVQLNINRVYTCEDYESSLRTHEQCMLVSNKKCTTSGNGCVKFGQCASYTSPIICASAKTTEIAKKCTWDNTYCRQLKCQDLKGYNDDECNTQLKGCISNGNICIGPTYDCSVFNGSQRLCLIDSSGQPCLYVNGICYQYDNCTDITKPTQELCQQFSNQCVVGSETCIALNQCSKYDKLSCIIGINKTKCGWSPNKICTEFTQCSDVAGKTWAECALWNETCVSDGTACVAIGDCSTYLTQLSCEGNRDKSNYQCIWSQDACKFKQCSDVVENTDIKCSSNTLKEGKCTTNGTTCIVRANCKSYITEASCTIGFDGIPCIFAYPVNQTNGVKSCRPKDCTDFKGTNNQQCQGVIKNKQCVSDGKTCINQGTCSSYKNNISCAGGGSDHPLCAFKAISTVTVPYVGICQAFTSCNMASGDPTTCLLNKSCKYTQSTKKCEATDCETFNLNEGKCNPIPSFDGQSFTICLIIDNKCKEGDPTTLTQVDCYSIMSQFSYTWNAQISKCQTCKRSTSSEINGSSIKNDVIITSEATIQFMVIAAQFLFL